MEKKKSGYLIIPKNNVSSKKGKRWRMLFWFSLTIILVLLLFSIAFAFALPKIIQTPDLDTLLKEKPLQVTRVYGDQGEIVGEFAKENRIPVKIDKMPKDLRNAIVAIEDKNFYSHGGIDPWGIARAMVRNIESGRKSQGASTIPQQLARIIYLNREKSYKRKLQEWVIAVQLSQKYSKNQVLEMYLNRVYLGHGMYGVEAASNFYFNKSVNKLTLAESALLAGLPQLPEVYSPFRSMTKAKQRRAQVLSRMVAEGYITSKQAQRAKMAPINLSKRRERFTASSYFVEQVRRQIVEDPNYGYAALYQEGLRIHTTMNSNYQKAAQDVLQRSLEQFEQRQQNRNNQIGKLAKGDFKANTNSYAKILKITSPTELSVTVHGQATRLILPSDLPYLKPANILKEGNYIPVKILGVNARKQPVVSFVNQSHVQGALIAVDPANGQIKAMVGGYDFRESEYNRAIQAYRQPGSAFKPIVYATALENGATPSDTIVDEPKSFDNWNPQNYDRKYRGTVTLRYALEQSLNIPVIKLASQYGIGNVVEYANKLGIVDNEQRKINHDLTIALGSLNVTPLEMAAAYSVFANGGTWHKPYFIKHISDAKNRKIEEFQTYSEKALNPQTAYVLTDMLRGVITKGTAANSIGRYFKYPSAGKTGTTNDYADAWFVGYTPKLVACSWVGYDQRKSLGSGMTGGSVAGPIWRDFMLHTVNANNAVDFSKPEGVVVVDICSASGKLATAACIEAAERLGPSKLKILHEEYKAGTEPKEFCDSEHNESELSIPESETDSESDVQTTPSPEVVAP